MGHDLTSMINAYRTAHIAELGNKSDIEVAKAMVDSGLYPDAVGDLTALISGAGSKNSPYVVDGKPTLDEKYTADDAPPLPKEAGIGLGVLGAAVAIGASFLSKGKIKIPKVALGLITAGGLASCVTKKSYEVDNSVTVNQDFGALAQAIQGLREDLKTFFQQFNEKFNSYSIQQKDLLNEIIAQLKLIQESERADDKEKTKLLQEIMRALDAANANDALKIGLLTEILNGVKSIKTNSVAYNTQAIALLETILAKISESNQVDSTFYEDVRNFMTQLNNKIKGLEDLGKDVADKLAPLLEKIAAEVKAGTEINAKGLNAIQTILGNIQTENAENTDKIVAAIQALWDNIKAGDAEAIALLKQISGDIQEGNAVDQAGFEAVIAAINAAQQKDDANTEAIMKVLQGLWNEVKNGNATITAQLTVITDLIGQCKWSLDGIKDMFGKLEITFPEQKDYDAVLNAILDALKSGVIPGINDIQNIQKDFGAAFDAAMFNIANLLKNRDIDLTTTNNLIQTVIDLMSSPQNPTYDDTNVTALLTEMNAMMKALLNKEGPDMQEFKNALNSYIKVAGNGTDLTTTNNLIQTAIDGLGNLIDSNASNRDIMAQVTNLGVQLTSVIAQLQEGNVTASDIMATLKRIEESVKALMAQANGS